MARKQGSHSDITGPRIREAATRLIARDGFAAVSMRQIAGEVGVQAGALYNYTPDKQSLLFDLMLTHMEDLMTAVSSQSFDDGDPLDRLDDFTRFHIAWHLPRRDAVFISYMELRNLSEANFQAIEALRRRYEDVLERILRAGMDSGRFEVSEPRLTTMALIALLTGVTNWYRTGGRLSQLQLERLYVDLVRKAAGAEPQEELAAQ